ncbi:hypothetical protein [Rubrivirga sp.]|uniref:hypothetical protein n=1 Tax=Rubrivirga sp. TaxID=1885344 RepID=UPI003B521D3E
MTFRRAARAATPLAAALAMLATPADAQPFERVATDVGATGLSVTNVGTLGRPGIANDPGGLPSFEYPLDSGIEHLFEAGLWVGGRRADGVVTVRTGAVTTSGGYSPGAPGFEFAQEDVFTRRSSLATSPFFSPRAVSQQDFLTSYSDTAAVLPGTNTPLPDVQNRLGLAVEQRSYAWSFPFTEYFVIVEYEITNVSSQPIQDVWVGLWDDLVVRNVVTTTEGGGAFFNKGARGVLGYPIYDANTGALLDAAPDSQFVSYAFNAGGSEESLNTYGSIAFLGAEWDDAGGAGRPAATRFFHPFVADEYRALGLPPPVFNPRFWLFADASPNLGRPADDLERYQRMQRPFPDPTAFGTQDEYAAARAAFLGAGQGEGRLQTDGRLAQGNWIGLTSVGPFAELAPGRSVTVTFALVAALKPDAFQTVPAGRQADTPESRALLRNNVFWAQETYAGEDANYNGALDAGEDLNGNGVLDRYLIPSPPASPALRVELEAGTAVLYWDDAAEGSLDPVTGRQDFEGYRVYRSDPGDDADGNILGDAGLIAQYDRPGNDVGFNNGFEAVRLQTPATFPGDPTTYEYRFEADGLLDGWQYAFAVTAFDGGDVQSGLRSLESSVASNAVRVFPGAAPSPVGEERTVGVFPNPYRVRAAWDGPLSTQRKLYFTGLPARCEIRVYTLAGEVVTELDHDAATYVGDTRWFEDFSAPGREVAGGVHAWDLLSDNSLRLSSGLYLFSVRDLDTGEVDTGKFVILR